MKTATRNLENDHIHILLLTRIMQHIAQSPQPQIQHIETVIDIIRKFADGFHHAKEEDLLFPMLGEKGFSSEQGPVAVMLNEHNAGRRYVKGMAEALMQYKNGDDSAVNGLRENIVDYVNLLNNHISKENNILFRMADNVLSESEQESLLKRFDLVEVRMEKNPDEYIKKINQLAEHYGLIEASQQSA